MRKLLEIGGLLAAAVLIAFGIGTHQRNKVWLSEETLWHDVTIKRPQNGRGMMNYGLIFMNRGEFDQALQYLKPPG